jgi:hypothetical protein
MAEDDATDEGNFQVVCKSRELRALSTELYEDHSKPQLSIF